MINTSDFNVAYHDDYASGIEKGLRIPIDDRGRSTQNDRAFALASNDPDWELGSINRVVKYMNDYNGVPVLANDLSDYNNGVMDLVTMRKYIRKSMLYGYKGEARNTVVPDMVSMRGYPTCEVVDIKWLDFDLNTNLETRYGITFDNYTSTRDLGDYQEITPLGTVLPIDNRSDYVTAFGMITLKEPIPMDRLFISLGVEFYIKEYLDLFKAMFNDTYNVDTPEFAAKTECYNSGDDLTFYFKMSAEVEVLLDNGSDYSARDIDIKIFDYRFTNYLNHNFHGYSGFQNASTTSIPCTYIGGKWVGTQSIVVDTAIPSTPANLTMDSILGGFATFTWDESTVDGDGGIKGYMLYGRRVEALNLKVFNTENYEGEFTWTNDITVELTEGIFYEFFVTSISNGGNESLPSSVITYKYVSNNLSIIKIDTTPLSTTAQACATNPSVSYYTNNPKAVLDGLGGVIYTDSAGINPFDGGDFWYGLSSQSGGGASSALKINSSGVAIGYTSCDFQPI